MLHLAVCRGNVWSDNFFIMKLWFLHPTAQQVFGMLNCHKSVCRLDDIIEINEIDEMTMFHLPSNGSDRY